MDGKTTSIGGMLKTFPHREENSNNHAGMELII